MTKRLAVATGICLTVALLLPTVCLAQSATLKLAMVNVTQVQDQSKEGQQAADQLKQWAAMKDAVYEKLKDYMLLPAADFAEVEAILEMPNPPADKQQRLADLKRLSDTKLVEYQDLLATAARTPEQEDRFKTLDEQGANCQAAMSDYATTAQDQLKQRMTEINDRMNTKIMEAVKSVAQVKGYTLVLSMKSLFYAVAPVDDITQDVVAFMNPPGAAPAGAPTTGGQPRPGGGGAGQ